jgi:hypothetical protein
MGIKNGNGAYVQSVNSYINNSKIGREWGAAPAHRPGQGSPKPALARFRGCSALQNCATPWHAVAIEGRLQKSVTAVKSHLCDWNRPAGMGVYPQIVLHRGIRTFDLSIGP